MKKRSKFEQFHHLNMLQVFVFPMTSHKLHQNAPLASTRKPKQKNLGPAKFLNIISNIRDHVDGICCCDHSHLPNENGTFGRSATELCAVRAEPSLSVQTASIMPRQLQWFS